MRALDRRDRAEGADGHGGLGEPQEDVNLLIELAVININLEQRLSTSFKWSFW